MALIWIIANALSSNQWRQHAIVLISAYLIHIIILIGFIHIRQSWQSHLISTVLVLEVVQVVFTSSHDVDWVISVFIHKIRALICSIVELAASVWRDVLLSLVVLYAAVVAVLLGWMHVVAVV